MDYPSTTQALFALIVMIIVLIFIMVYCCWGTFSCAEQENMGEGSGAEGMISRRDSPPAFVILPYRNMIYIGHGQTQQVYQIPLTDDKPPSYRDIFTNVSLPPAYHSRGTLAASEPPPTYEQCTRSTDEIQVSNLRDVDPNRILGPSTTSSLPIHRSTMPQRQAFLSPSIFHKRSPTVFRASSLLTVSPPNSPSNFLTSLIRTHKMIPSIPLISSDLPLHNSNLMPPSTAQLSSSNPCLPSTSTTKPAQPQEH